MKTIILLADTDANRLAQISRRPRPLLNVAGKTILRHLLDLLGEALNGPVIFVAGEQADEVADWLEAQYPQLDAQFVAQEGILGQAQAIALCGDYLDEDDVLVVAGMVIAEAAWDDLPGSRMDAVFVTPPDTAVSPNPTAAITWFKNGRLLHHALQSAAPSATLQDVCQEMQAGGTAVTTLPAHLWLETDTPEALLHANQRLLGLGYGATPDAIERSYAEDFTVLPPVYIDEEAYVETAVIGPYVSIYAGAVVKDAIVRHSIIAADAHVETCILDGALVGERAKITSSASKLVALDDSITDLTTGT